MSPNDADGMANSVDPDQATPLGAVWSGSALFAKAYLSENLGSLRYNFSHSTWSIFHSYQLTLDFSHNSEIFVNVESKMTTVIPYQIVLISEYLHLPLTFLRWNILDQLASYTDEGQLIMWRYR